MQEEITGGDERVKKKKRVKTYRKKRESICEYWKENSYVCIYTWIGTYIGARVRKRGDFMRASNIFPD